MPIGDPATIKLLTFFGPPSLAAQGAVAEAMQKKYLGCRSDKSAGLPICMRQRP
jgi:hypothetical protein